MRITDEAVQAAKKTPGQINGLECAQSSLVALSAEPAQGDDISVSDAAKVLRSENNMWAIRDACDGICKVYRFRDVLDRLAAPTTEAGRAALAQGGGDE